MIYGLILLKHAKISTQKQRAGILDFATEKHFHIDRFVSFEDRPDLALFKSGDTIICYAWNCLCKKRTFLRVFIKYFLENNIYIYSSTSKYCIDGQTDIKIIKHAFELYEDIRFNFLSNKSLEAAIVRDKTVSDKLELQKRFGYQGDNHYMLGINAKQSEFHAGMGLANFPYIDKIIENRKQVSETYDSLLNGCVIRPKAQIGLKYNYAYYPVVFKNETELLKVFSALNEQDVFPRRYFYPSLNKLTYVQGNKCPVSEDITSRIACLPLYVGLEKEHVQKISQVVKDNLCR